MFRKHRDTIEQRTKLGGLPTGFNNNFILEKVPKLRTSSSKKVVEGKNNSFIVLGRDQPGNLASGAGGKGMTSCGAIDIIAGLDSSNGPSENEVDPNFFNDASRIYLTQKGKIENDFGLAKGSSRWKDDYSSGVGIKSDKVCMVGRDHIKITTGKARINGLEKNSGGGEFAGVGSIDLIAGNSTNSGPVGSFSNLGSLGSSSWSKTMQPLLKGDNTAKLLEEIIDKLTELNGMILDNRTALVTIGQSYIQHVHIGANAGGPLVATPSPNATMAVEPVIKCFTKISDNVIASANDGALKVNYLDPNFPSFIKSKGVNTT